MGILKWEIKYGFENCVKALNNIAKAYINPKMAVSARSVGTSSISVEVSGVKDMTYTADYEQMEKLGIKNTSNIKNYIVDYFLASRAINVATTIQHSGYTCYSIRYHSNQPNGLEPTSLIATRGYLSRGQDVQSNDTIGGARVIVKIKKCGE